MRSFVGALVLVTALPALAQSTPSGADLPIRATWDRTPLDAPPYLGGYNQVSAWSWGSGGSPPMVRANLAGLERAVELHGNSKIDWWIKDRTSGRLIVEATVVVLEGLPPDLVAPFPSAQLVSLVHRVPSGSTGPVFSLSVTSFGDIWVGPQVAGPFTEGDPFRLRMLIDIDAAAADAWIDFNDGTGYGQVAWDLPVITGGPLTITGLRLQTGSSTLSELHPERRFGFDDIVVRWVP